MDNYRFGIGLFFKKYILTGNLTLHGVTKSVTLDLQYKGSVQNPMSKKQTEGFKRFF